MASIRRKNKVSSFWDVVKLSSAEYMLARNIEFAITNKLYFVILYIIDPDLLVYSICKQIRESGRNDIPNLPDDDMLEDVVGVLIDKMFGQVWFLTRDLNRALADLKNEIVARLAQNENQKLTNKNHNQRW